MINYDERLKQELAEKDKEMEREMERKLVETIKSLVKTLYKSGQDISFTKNTVASVYPEVDKWEVENTINNIYGI